MRKHLLRSWLLVCAVVLGFAQSWADDITSLPFNVNFTVEDNSTSPFDGGAVVTGTNLPDGVLSLCGATAKAYFDVDAATEGRQAYVLSDNEEVTMSFVAYHGWENKGKTQGVKLMNSQGVVIASYEYTLGDCNITDVKIGGQTVVGFSAYNAQGYFNGSKSANGLTHSQSYQADDAKNTKISFSLHKLGVVTINIKKEVSGLDKTYVGLLDADVAKDLASIEAYSNSATVDRALCIDNLSITTATVEKVVARYTVNYVCGEELIKSESLEGLEGAEPAISTAAIYANGNKYIYESNDAETVGALSGSEDKVYTVYFKKAAVGNVLIQTNGKEFKKIENVFDGDDVTFWMPYYLFLETTKEAVLDEGGNEVEPAKTYTGFFKLADSKRLEGKYGQFTVTFVKPNRVNNMAVNIEYTEEENSNAVFYAEAEDIETLTKYQDNFTEIRMSNGAAAYAAEDGTVVATVPAGKYTIESASRSGNTYFSVNGNQVLAVESSGSVVIPTGAFTAFGEETAITVSKGSASVYFDYVLIRKTSDEITAEDIAAYNETAAAADMEKLDALQADLTQFIAGKDEYITADVRQAIETIMGESWGMAIEGAYTDATEKGTVYVSPDIWTILETQIAWVKAQINANMPVLTENTVGVTRTVDMATSTASTSKLLSVEGITVERTYGETTLQEVAAGTTNETKLMYHGNRNIVVENNDGVAKVTAELSELDTNSYMGVKITVPEGKVVNIDRLVSCFLYDKNYYTTVAIENNGVEVYNTGKLKFNNYYNNNGRCAGDSINVTSDGVSGLAEATVSKLLSEEITTEEAYLAKDCGWTIGNNLTDKVKGLTGTVELKLYYYGKASVFAIKDLIVEVSVADVDPTGVNNAIVENTVSTGAVYNLAGQKVSSNFKGIVIMNGKKVMVK